MSNDENTNGIISKTFKNKDYLLNFLKTNDISQFSVTQQISNGAWKISFPKELYNRKDKHVEPDPEPPTGA